VTPLLVTLGLQVLPVCEAYCSIVGPDPGFSSAPRLEQVSLTSVRVSWHNIVTKIECADQFIVKSWNARNPNDYIMSNLLPLSQFTYVVTDLVPNQDYVFQVVAREDKGILGKDWNKSPQAMYRTGRHNPTVPPNSDNTYSDPARQGPIPTGSNQSGPSPQSLFTMGGITVGVLLALLIVVGVLWNIIQKSRRKTTDTDSVNSDSETDSMDLDLENTDLESRVGSIRASSRISTIRSSTVRSGGARTRLRSPRRFSFTPSEPPDSPTPSSGSVNIGCITQNKMTQSKQNESKVTGVTSSTSVTVVPTSASVTGVPPPDYTSATGAPASKSMTDDPSSPDT